jgi:hypothetical protein
MFESIIERVRRGSVLACDTFLEGGNGRANSASRNAFPRVCAPIQRQQASI